MLLTEEEAEELSAALTKNLVEALAVLRRAERRYGRPFRIVVRIRDGAFQTVVEPSAPIAVRTGG